MINPLCMRSRVTVHAAVCVCVCVSVCACICVYVCLRSYCSSVELYCLNVVPTKSVYYYQGFGLVDFAKSTLLTLKANSALFRSYGKI